MSPTGVRMAAELSRLRRSPFAVGALLLWLLFAGGAIAMQSIRYEARASAQAEGISGALEEQIEDLRARHSPATPLGEAAYYLRFPVSPPHPGLSVLSGGAWEQSSSVSHLRLLSLVPQIFDASTAHPGELAAGPFDLAFVIVVLLPLLLIALGHDALSREHEAGTADLTAAQPLSLRRLALERLTVVGTAVGAALLGGIAIAPLAIGPLEPARLALFALASMAYLGVWQLGIGVVACSAGSATSHAARLVGAWLVLTLIGPALLNVALAAAFPSRSTAELVLDQRLAVNGAWDEPRENALVAFRTRHPQYASLEVPTDAFSWPWYYAMQENGDHAVRADVDRHLARVEARERFARRASVALPPLALQRVLDHLAGTDLEAALAHRASIAAYHRDLRAELFSRIAAGAELGDLRAESVPRHAPPEPPPVEVPFELAALAIWGFVLGLLLRGTRPGLAGATVRARLQVDHPH